MSSSFTALQPARCGPDFKDRSPYRHHLLSGWVAHSLILQPKLRWAGPKPPVRSERVPRPTAARRGRDGFHGRSRARGGEVLRFKNPCTSSPPPFRGCAGLYTPSFIARTPPSRQLPVGTSTFSNNPHGVSCISAGINSQKPFVYSVDTYAAG